MQKKIFNDISGNDFKDYTERDIPVFDEWGTQKNSTTLLDLSAEIRRYSPNQLLFLHGWAARQFGHLHPYMQTIESEMTKRMENSNRSVIPLPPAIDEGADVADLISL